MYHRKSLQPPVAFPGNLSGQLVNATQDAAKCIQFSSPGGSEDCLYLNVYTPQFQNSSELRPVMVWIYGGSFIDGNSDYSTYGPDYLINQDVIVVTLNYRLGVFGFLSTEDYVSPGNYGLKDQIMALRWVQENIEYFGGNCGKVTLFGESAGSASVSYLTQAPITKGLFQSAIMESGTSLSSWALAPNGREITLRIANILLIDTSSSQAIVEGLRRLDAADLQKAVRAAFLQDILKKNQLTSMPFGPTIEPIHPGAVVVNYSYEQLQNGLLHNIPYIIGYNSFEALPLIDLLKNFRLILSQYDLDPTRLVTPSMNVHDSPTKLNLSLLIKNHYFGNTPISLSPDESILQFISDDLYVRPILKTATLCSQSAPVYLYKFSYQGALGSGKRKQRGVGHSEELPYIWRMANNRNEVNPSDLVTRKRMVTLWANFAKYGNPTPAPATLLENVTWPLANENEFGLGYLNINVTLNASRDPDWKSFLFWTNLFKKFGNRPFTTY
ncbi:hypothetical protein PPYR_10237 [Photinus pyralis]|uniref:Carboxylic ester hydrolase n=1 Tax=Photinus pyralis TaxID=7054 RepID=A0A5N4AFV5_PHOPY|nr:hypothetical protein PPYR_10237 [Photinus pyralis]